MTSASLGASLVVPQVYAADSPPVVKVLSGNQAKSKTVFAVTFCSSNFLVPLFYKWMPIFTHAM